MADPALAPKRALVIAHEPDGPGGQVARRLRDREFEVVTHVVTSDADAPNTANPWPDLAAFDVVAIMGSVRSLTQKHLIDSWVYDELELIRQARAADMPLLGVCFGGQLIAEALGGSVEVSDTTEIGWFEIEDGPSTPNPVGPGPWMEWHHDRFTAPPDATVLATTPSAVQLFSVGRMVGTQFHPEVDVAHIEGWLEFADDEYLDEHGVNAASVLDQMRSHEARNNDQCSRLVDWFLDDIAFPNEIAPMRVTA